MSEQQNAMIWSDTPPSERGWYWVEQDEDIFPSYWTTPRKARRRMQAKIQISERKEVKASGHTFVLVPAPKHPGRYTLTIKPIALDTEQKQAKT